MITDCLRKIMPPVYAAIFIVFMVLAEIFCPLKIVLISTPYNFAGAVFILLGLFVIFKCMQSFNAAGTPLRPFTESAALVTDGIFKYSRNPIYLAMTAILFGEVILLNNLIHLIFPIILICILNFAFIVREEEILKVKFKDQYLEYCRNVRRWI